MNKTLISVLNYNNFQATKNCVYSILKYSRENSEVFIVDNNSSDDSVKFLIKEFPSLKIIKSESNNGYASGHKISVNYAIKNNFNYIWILNNDLIVRKNSLTALLNAANKNGLGLYGSITLKSEKPDIINFGGGTSISSNSPFNFNSFENITLQNYNKKIGFREVQSIEGSSFLIPLKVINKFGFMKEDFFMYGEEVDYCYFLREKKIKSYIEPKSIVIHKGGESLKKTKYIEEYYRKRNFLIIMKRYYKQSIFKYIVKKVGLISYMKFLCMYFLNIKSSTYYFNLGVLHALLNKKGKLIE